MPCVPWESIGRRPAPPLPSWLAGSMVVGRTTVSITQVAVQPIPPTVLCPANPLRVMVGFASRTNSDLRIFPEGGTLGVNASAAGGTHDDFSWFTVFDHGPLPTLSWLGLCFPAATIDVYQVTLLNRG